MWLLKNFVFSRRVFPYSLQGLFIASQQQNIDVINQQRQELHFLTLPDFAELSPRLKNSVQSGELKTIAGLTVPAQDILLANKLILELGLMGRAVAQDLYGKTYIVLKGYPGLRQNLTGTRYLESHPKVVDLAIGQTGMNARIISGVRLSIFIAVPLNVLQCFLSNQSSLIKLIGTTATDIVKLGISALVGSVAAFAVASVTTVVVGPLIAAIGLGVMTSFALEYIDNKFGVTAALIVAIEKAHNATFGHLAREINRFERGIIDNAMSRMRYR